MPNPRTLPNLSFTRALRAEDFKHSFQENLKYRLIKESETATDYDRYLSLAYAIRDRLVENWVATQKTYRDQKVKAGLLFILGIPHGTDFGQFGY